jgi:hypothetical protein
MNDRNIVYKSTGEFLQFLNKKKKENPSSFTKIAKNVINKENKLKNKMRFQ